jgi:glycosyltransferase involved in cell wall biosynthesis
MMDLCIVVPYFTPYIRGNEYGLAQSLVNLGHSVTIVTSTAKAPREKAINTVTQEEHPDFSVECLPTLIDAGDNPIITGIDKYIQNHDVVMLQEDYPFICHRAYAVSRKLNIPTVLSSERTYYPESIVKRHALRFLDATINMKLREEVDVLTAHCMAAKDFMIGELEVKREISVIHVGVDTELFRPTDSERVYLTDGGFRILTAARLHRYKGLDYLIEAMKRIIEEIPDAHLYILGKGSEELNLKSFAKKLQLNEMVTFLTRSIPNHEMPTLYAECDVYVQPSIVEPYGIAVLEAMACGKPVVGTRVGGMRDTINEETGFLAEPGNSEEIAKYIKLLYNENTRQKMGMAARKRALEEFDWRHIAQKYIGVINAIE